VILATLTWIYTHRLDPYKPLKSSVKPLEVQVIALDWKWLFIYPERNVAAVNELAFPVNRPVDFRITSNTVMNSFFIPRLGGQIYAMAGMETQLHLMANKPGSYFGENIQYSGRGFPYQHFVARATPLQGFGAWVKKTRESHSIWRSSFS
jgi:cytochrome o ubiquinol oxidase subunit 2